MRSSKREAAGAESVDSLQRRIEELERWFQRQDRQIRFLERERQKLSALVNHTDAGFLVFDPALSASWLNNVCRGWFGGNGRTRSSDATSCNELLCGSQQVCLECPVAHALASEAVSHCEMRLDLDAGERHIYATAMPIKSPDNRVDQCILMLQDITDLEVLRRSQEALLFAKEVAESANRSKSEFLANMSHEVRTPMTGILSMSSFLLDTPLSNEQRECVGIIQSAGSALLTIINDILDFSRIEAGRLPIEAVSFDLRTTVDEVVALVAEKADEKGIELILRCPSDVPWHVVGDAGRIRQVLTNLVANAIKFTHAGHILINIARLGGDEVSTRVLFSVEDTGIGIPTEKLGRVFEKFTQADGSITRQYGGTGLGLAISKQLVELMHGEVFVTSTLGAGSTFSFTLPLALDVDAPRAPRAGNLENRRILVLHCYEKARNALLEQVADWNGHGVGVATASAALAALQAADAAGAPFHIMVVARDLPDLSPDVLARRIRDDASLRAMGLVLLTTLGQGGGAERLRSDDFVAHLTGPTRPWQLLDVLCGISGAREVGRSESSRGAPNEPVPSISARR